MDAKRGVGTVCAIGKRGSVQSTHVGPEYRMQDAEGIKKGTSKKAAAE